MRTTSGSEDQDFVKSVISETLLEQAAEYIADNFPPEDVYPVQKLRDWAIDNGWVEKED